jgi:phosphoribosylanthranilate isomerase
MFTVKICGITTIDDAQCAVRAGADAVGVNFYPGSPRCVTPAGARAILESLPPGIVKVGVFVDAEPAAACAAFDALGLDLLQFHGDEPPGRLAELGGRPVMKAFRLGAGVLQPMEHDPIGPTVLQPVEQYLNECRRLGCLPRLVLLDAQVPGAYGGTGQVADWSAARQYRMEITYPPMVLAGGLRADNVAAAIRATGALGVDTASGVEARPGRKDPAAVAAFVRAAREALASAPSPDIR